MSAKRAFSAVLIGGLVLTLLTISRAQVDTRRIEEVLKKDVLTQQDFAVIDAFVNEAIGRLVRTIDFTEVAKTRAYIVSHQGAQAQYAQRFSEALQREIAAGFDYAANEISDAERRFRVFTNLLILVNELKDPQLVDLAVRMLPHANAAVRYWAVRTATSPEIWSKLSQDQASAAPLARKIIDASGPIVAASRPEVLYLMAEFAGRYDTVPAEDLLGRIADVRIGQYATWAVEYELADTAILRLLCDKITAGGTANPQLAKQFAQLYSYAIQRYIKGIRADNLKGLSRNYLASVLIDTEEQCLGRLLGTPQANVRRAIEAADLDALQAEHDRLLGGPNQTGTLPSKLRFTYGSPGDNRSVPLAMPEPAQERAVAETQTAQP